MSEDVSRRSTLHARKAFHHVEPEAPTEEVELGALIDDKYRVVDQLGEGAMGVVMRGRDERLERDVAIKLIKPEWVGDADFHQKFLAEARAMARVKHPNVVDVYDFGSTNDVPYIVMEFIDGLDLESWIDRRSDPMLSIDEALGILDRICRGVAAIHEAGTVHRDLKPANVLVRNDFGIAVADLGLASFAAKRDGGEPVVGSPGFIAPETLKRAEVPAEMQARADIYALGAIAYELLTGEPAFMGETAREILDAQVETIPVPASLLRPELTGAFDPVIAAAMEMDPTDRIDSVSSLRRALQDARARAFDPSIGRRIVIAEPERKHRGKLEDVLTHGLPGVTVDFVDSGVAALHGVSSGPTSMVITELRLPELSGVDLVRILRADSQFNHVPVVVLTSHGGAEDWKSLREMGADGFQVKPLDPVVLLALVRSLLDTPLRNRVGHQH